MPGAASYQLGLEPGINFTSQRAGETDSPLCAGEPGDKAALNQSLRIEREMEIVMHQLAAQPRQ